MTTKYCYVVFTGQMNTDGYLDSVFRNKVTAIIAIKSEGFKYNTEQNLFLCYESNRWYRIDKAPYGKTFSKSIDDLFQITIQ